MASVTPPTPIVIVHRNRPALLARSLEAWAAQTVPVHIVLVDSGSTEDAHTEAVAGLPAGSTVIRMGRNGGFGPSANAGFREILARGGSEWIGLAPHDALPAPDAVERILAAVADRPRAGFACGDYGDAMSPSIDPFLGSILVPAGTDQGWDPVTYPHGTLFFARRAALEDVGLFDERYFAYGEEAELGLRAARAGWEVGLVRGARVDNPNMSNARPAIDYLMVRNTFLLLREWFGRRNAAFRMAVAVVQVWTGRRSNPHHTVSGHLYAMVDFARGRTGPPPARLERTTPVA